ncbi:MAG: hypothetical protein OXF62_08300 [Caldilineaceae bacterium]|nr:hypothetical protein [Caldilineaceae bacterium]
MNHTPSSEDKSDTRGSDSRNQREPDTLRETAQEYRSESPEDDAIREEVMAHYQDSVKRNHRLAELLAQ